MNLREMSEFDDVVISERRENFDSVMGQGLQLIPVHGDAEEVEDGGGGEHHVHGIVHVTQPDREQPVAVQEDTDAIKHHRPNGHREI